jgi:hypothetical protein
LRTRDGACRGLGSFRKFGSPSFGGSGSRGMSVLCVADWLEDGSAISWFRSSSSLRAGRYLLRPCWSQWLALSSLLSAIWFVEDRWNRQDELFSLRHGDVIARAERYSSTCDSPEALYTSQMNSLSFMYLRICTQSQSAIPRLRSLYGASEACGSGLWLDDATAVKVQHVIE